MPKLWNDTIAAHRREVREAILRACEELVAERGLLGVTMSEVAAKTGIGRATLYKYFPDVQTILLAWHEGQVSNHLAQLVQARDEAADPSQRLDAVLEAYALIGHQSHRQHDPEVVALLHRDHTVIRAEREVHRLLQELLEQGVATGDVRADVAPHELASYCLHALSAARRLESQPAVRRLVAVTRAGLRPVAG